MSCTSNCSDKIDYKADIILKLSIGFVKTRFVNCLIQAYCVIFLFRIKMSLLVIVVVVIQFIRQINLPMTDAAIDIAPDRTANLNSR